MILYMGLGRMGLPMAIHALKAGHDVVGFDPVAERRALLAEAGGAATDDASALYPTASAVVVMVGSENDVSEIVAGENGIIARGQPGTLVLIVSTVSPDLVARLGGLARVKGIRVVDAPVCRAEMGAVSGTLLAFLSGDDDDCRDAKAVMQPYCADIELVGQRLGAAQIAKTVNNMILWACAVANEEGMRLAGTWDLDLAALRRALVTSSADNWCLRHWDRIGAMPWSIKDMDIALQTARDAGVALPLAQQVGVLVRSSTVLSHA
ncbi:MAG TPA: NAD(P)-dependent oxidoreductase [Rhodopila sp.]